MLYGYKNRGLIGQTRETGWLPYYRSGLVGQKLKEQDGLLVNLLCITKDMSSSPNF